MCEKCNYKIRDVLKEAMGGEDNGQCFIQAALKSDDPVVKHLGSSLIRALTFGKMGVKEFCNRLVHSLENNEMEDSRKGGYRDFLKLVPCGKKLDETSAEYKEDVFGGLIE